MFSIAFRVWAIVFSFFLIVGVSGLAYQRIFAPQHEKVRRATFVQSQSYIDGKITHLNRLRSDYVREKDSVAKCALRSVVLHEAVTATKIPDELNTWVVALRGDTACA